jgi:hypothetical protein
MEFLKPVFEKLYLEMEFSKRAEPSELEDVVPAVVVPGSENPDHHPTDEDLSVGTPDHEAPPVSVSQLPGTRATRHLKVKKTAVSCQWSVVS